MYQAYTVFPLSIGLICGPLLRAFLPPIALPDLRMSPMLMYKAKGLPVTPYFVLGRKHEPTDIQVSTLTYNNIQGHSMETHLQPVDHVSGNREGDESGTTALRSWDNGEKVATCTA